MPDQGVNIRLDSRADAIPLTLEAVFLGEDLSVALSGGDRAHIGAVAVARPRPSLKDSGAISATASVITLLGHKEDDLACRMAKKLAGSMNVVVSVACGIHVNGIDLSQINAVESAVRDLVDRLIVKCRNASSP